MTTTDQKRKTDGWFFLAAFVIVALAMFARFLRPGAILFTTDDNIGALALRKALLPGGFLHPWNDNVLVGVPDLIMLTWTTLLLWIAPLTWFTTWIHAIDLVFGSFFLALFLRERGLSRAAGLFGALGAFWIGNNLTLTYAGHIGKFGVLAMSGLALWTIERGARTRRLGWWALSGGAVGLMFLEQADVALFFCMFWFPYAALAWFREARTSGKPSPRAAAGGIGRLWIVMAAIGLLIGARAFQANLQPDLAGDTTEAPADASTGPGSWSFATQWSWPPEESLDFIAPGYFGWRSGEPAGPYWGRMGRSDGWERTRQGFPNFKLENHYMSMAVCGMALVALLAAAWARREDKAWAMRWDVAVWGVIALLALLLAFGKYAPLYRLFFALPGMSAIRNPNKFLHIFQIAVGILSAYGLDALWGARRDTGLAPACDRKATAVRWLFAALLTLFVLAALSSFSSWGAEIGRMRLQGWGAAAETIVKNRAWAWLQAAAVTGLLTLGLWLLRGSLNASVRRYAPWALCALVLLESMGLARHYLNPMPPGYIRANSVTDYLRKHLGHERVYMPSQDGFYNLWLTYLFPYWRIPAFNVTQMPRMAPDYQRFLNAAQRRPDRLWDLTAIGYLLGPSGIAPSLQGLPGLKDRLMPELGFEVTGGPNNDINVSSGPPSPIMGQRVWRFARGVPRYALIGAWEVRDEADALARAMEGGFQPGRQVVLSGAGATGLSPSGAPGPAGEVSVLSYRPGQVALRVKAERPAVLRAADKFDPNWTARIDGQPQPLMRCDYLFQGVAIEPGEHRVDLVYAPGAMTLYVQFLGMGLCVLAALGLLIRRRTRAEAADAS